MATVVAAREQLREQATQRGAPRSSFRGVCQTSGSKNKWKAQITHGGKRHYLGSFHTKEEAAAAHDAAARKFKGNDARCNFDSAEAAAAAVATAVAAWELEPQQAMPPAGSGQRKGGGRFQATFILAPGF